jgi:uncharacterized RDD family membrane protein YckC
MLLGGIKMYCKTCGSENPDGAKVCEKCGASLVEMSYTGEESDEVRYTGFFKRALAYIIDVLILGVVDFAIASILKGAPYTLTTLIVALAYFAIMESSKFQGSLGKMLLKIKVTDENGERLSILKTGARYIILEIFSILSDIVGIIPGKSSEINPNDISTIMKSLTDLPHILAYVGFIYGIIVLISILSSEYKQGIHDKIVKSYVVDK